MKRAVKRPYQSALRDEQARQTRRVIVGAAAELFVQRGYAGTTVDAIAERAGVSRKTVFTSVGGKPEALKLAIDWANVGDDEPVPMLERPRVLAAMAEPDARVILEMYAEDLVAITERTYALFGAMQQAVGTDPAIDALAEETARQRVVGLLVLAQQLGQRGALRPDLTVEQARDVLCAMTESGAYRWLVVRQGWGRERFQAWVADTLVHVLIDPAYQPPHGRRSSAPPTTR